MKKNDQKTEMLKPLIFNKKINLKHKIIPLEVISNTIGPTRVFPTATKEWYNSVYAYNQSYIKNLSIADKTLSRLVKSYFNFYFNKKVLDSSKIAIRFRRLSLNKILISKAELKHTSSKVTVTLYTYNAEKIYLTLKLKNLIKAYFTSKVKNLNIDPSLINLLHDINVYKKEASLVDYLEELKSNLKSNLDYKADPYMQSYLDIINEMIILSKNDKTANKKLDQIYTESLRKNFLSKEIKEIATCKLLLNLNKSKFEDEFIFKLKGIIGKLYNKEVEFNIINLKSLYFNSDIFTEVISTKLKDRKNKLLNVLKSSLYLVRLPRVNRIKENSIKADKICLDYLKNLHVNSSTNKYNTDKDTLDQILLGIYPSTFMSGDKDKTPLTAYNENYINTYNPLDIVLDSLKNKDIGGVRLEAKGRLGKSAAASRSVFKVKWKGSIKNLDSSYRKLSTVMLRGHAKSNVQYTVINSKTRSGAFGLKGWISSK